MTDNSYSRLGTRDELADDIINFSREVYEAKGCLTPSITDKLDSITSKWEARIAAARSKTIGAHEAYLARVRDSYLLRVEKELQEGKDFSILNHWDKFK